MVDSDNSEHDSLAANQVQAPLPLNLTYAGVVAGCLLIFVGIGIFSFGRAPLLASLMTCVGFGLVLASFGSTAQGSWAGWSVTGSGAMAIVLFLVLQHYQPAPLPPVFKKGQLRGDLSKIADIRIIDELPMYGYRDKTTSSIKFVLLDNRLKNNRLSIQVDTTERGEGREFFEIVGDAQAIQTRYLTDQTSDKQIQWTFDYDRRVVKDGTDIIFAEQDSLQVPPPVRRSDLRLPAIDFWLTSAHAMDSAAPVALTPSAIQALITLLKSDDTAVRRNARDALAASGPNSVPAMMSAVRADPSNYRIRLGAIYAMSDMLRRNIQQRAEISSALKNEDFPLLAAAASDDDKTIRFQAAEFLYHLQDPRSVPAGVAAARSTSDENKAANQVIIIGKSADSFSPEQKEKVINDLTVGPGSNNALVGNSVWLRGKLGF
jgi:hypothetical protein